MSSENDGVDSSLRATSGDELIAPSTAQKKKLSWRRVILGVIAAMLIVVPVLIYFELDKLISGGQPSGLGGTASLAQLGSGRRGFAPFELSNAAVPRNEIHAGGPPKDGIPALSRPQLIEAQAAAYLAPHDRVIGVVAGADARAYPLEILNYHEIVNDQLGNLPVAVTYCPLCDSAAVFDRRTELGLREFGVSGLLYNSNVLMYDRAGQTESLWSQIKAQGISGPGAHKRLKSLPLELTTWSDWTRRYPHTKVLSSQTGHQRDYGRSPYGGYFQSPRLMFPASPTSDRLPTKERVLGVWSGDASRAYPASAFSADRPRAENRLDGKRLVVEFTPDANSLRVVEADEGVQWMYSLWFAWYAMHPETDVYQAAR